jgi:hypothetical protein
MCPESTLVSIGGAAAWNREFHREAGSRESGDAALLGRRFEDGGSPAWCVGLRRKPSRPLDPRSYAESDARSAPARETFDRTPCNVSAKQVDQYRVAVFDEARGRILVVAQNYF